MTLDQMMKKKEACEERIKRDTEEKERLQEEIKKQAGEAVVEHVVKEHISIADFLKLLNGHKERLQPMFDSLGKEEKEKQDDKKEKNNETRQ